MFVIWYIVCFVFVLVMFEIYYDMVWVGVVIYGFWLSLDVYYQYLQFVSKMKDIFMSCIIIWKLDIMDIKYVLKGDFIGYGMVFQVMYDMDIVVILVGYCNGYFCGQFNWGYVLINGWKVWIIGLINMNFFMVDIGDILNVNIGDEVVLLGKQKNNIINVSFFINYMQLLNNEMLSCLFIVIFCKIV